MEGFELKEPDPTAFRDVPRLLAGLPRASAPDTVFAYCNRRLQPARLPGGSGGRHRLRRLRDARHPRAARHVADALLRRAGRTPKAPAIGYEGRTPVPVYPMRDIPAGALLSTAADMERFMGFVFDQGPGRRARPGGVRRDDPPAERARSPSTGTSPIGLGYWLITPFAVDDAFVSHAGDIPPFHTVLVTIPDGGSASSSPRTPRAIPRRSSRWPWSSSARCTPSRRGSRSTIRRSRARVRLDRGRSRATGRPVREPARSHGYAARGGRLLARVRRPARARSRARTAASPRAEPARARYRSLSRLEKVRFSPLESGGRTYLRITTLGIMAGVAEKLAGADVPQAWKAGPAGTRSSPAGRTRATAGRGTSRWSSTAVPGCCSCRTRSPGSAPRSPSAR